MNDAALLSAVTDPALRDLASYGVIREEKKGVILFKEGEAGDTLSIILAGRVEIYLSDDKGNKMIIAVRGPGECFGEMSLESGQKRSASVVCLESCKFAVLTRKTLLDALRADPEVALFLVSTLIQRVRFTTELVRDLSLSDVYQRVAKKLLEMARPQPDGSVRVEEKISQAEIGRRVGAGRDMVNKIFNALIEGGYIRLADGHIHLLQKTLPPAF